MHTPYERRTKLSLTRLAGLYCLFFLIAWGLGYPILNRYDPSQTPGLTDVRSYRAIVTGSVQASADHVRFRVLVPWMARPFYQLAQGKLGSWDPVRFGLLIADSLFVAATALLIVVLGSRLGNYAVSLVASLLYFCNFAVPNLRLVGLVDAGEGFFLLALLWSLSELKLWALPCIAALGALSKESFVPIGVTFTAAWWIVSGRNSSSWKRSAIWIVSSWIVTLAATVGVQSWVAGRFTNPIDFVAALHGNHQYLRHFLSSLADRNLWYIFVWLLPLGIPHLGRFPKSWLIPTAAAAATVFILDGYYGGAAGTVGRALFSVAGPLLALSCASFLVGHHEQNTAVSADPE
jgi:hypothetical protein